jgi:hypothetical protein
MKTEFMINNQCYFLIIFSLFFILGCSDSRFIPSHGGGKRFDEEQRAVASAIRTTIAQMDIEPIEGKTVQQMIVSMSHSGGATVQFPNFTAGMSYNWSDANYGNLVESPNPTWVGYPVPDVQNSLNANVNYTRNLNAWPTVFSTDQDITYFDAALQMRLRMAGCTVVPANPEYILFVLVDVLGLNRSRADGIIYLEERLLASCDITYYIFDVKNNKVLGEAVQVSSQASYKESLWLGSMSSKVEKAIYHTRPTEWPLEQESDYLSNRKPTFMDVLLFKNNCHKDKKSEDDGAVKETEQEDQENAEPVAQKTAVLEAEQTAEDSAALKADLQKKLDNAMIQINSLNIHVAEQALNEIREVDPAFPGLDVAYSRLEQVKADITRQMQSQ